MFIVAAVTAPSRKKGKRLAVNKTQQICCKESLSYREIDFVEAGLEAHLQLILRETTTSELSLSCDRQLQKAL